MFLLYALFALVYKSNRLIYIIITIEMMLVRVLVYYAPMMRGGATILFLFFIVIRSVTIVTILVKIVRTYGEDLVME